MVLQRAVLLAAQVLHRRAFDEYSSAVYSICTSGHVAEVIGVATTLLDWDQQTESR